jgi:aspartate dehydrogenase
MPGLDWMHASSLGALDPATQHVTVTQSKPCASWKGARFKPGSSVSLPDEHDFDAMTKITTVFEGSARQAASQFPKNANISAMLAIATAGLDNTMVRLVADPTTPPKMKTVVEYEGPAGKIRFEGQGLKSLTNPRTSVVVPLAVIKALKNMCSGVAIGV